MAVNPDSSGQSGAPAGHPGEAPKEPIDRTLPAAPEARPRYLSDAQRVRELLRRAGLSVRAAARELEIDEPAMRSYCTGAPVPRYLMLAIERLIDVPRMKVYHISKAENAGGILAHGFRDGAGTDMSAWVQSGGVWVSDKLLVLPSNIDLNDMACFEIKVSEEWLARYERTREGRGYREFLVPAAELNDFPRRRLPDKEWLSMPWGR